MWFKNLTIYRLPQRYAITAARLEESLSKLRFIAALSGEVESYGFISPNDSDNFVVSANSQFLASVMFEKKLLPASVVNQVTKAKAEDLEDDQGYRCGRKQLKDLKDRVFEELLPQAFPIQSRINFWIDPVNGWLGIDTSSASKADAIIKLLLKCVATFPLEGLHVKITPQSAMTDWLSSDSAPVGFTIDQDTELKAHTQDKAAIRYVHHSLDPEDVKRHIAAGKQCTKLAVTWNDRISFVLTSTLGIKRIKALDILDDGKAPTNQTKDEQFEADFALMTGEFNQMLDALIDALGGEMNAQADLVAHEAQVLNSTPDEQNHPLPAIETEAQDPLYAKAVAIVVQHQRASISLVQRHLRIGYNHAAHLVESMEINKVLSPMEPNGSRKVLVKELQAA